MQSLDFSGTVGKLRMRGYETRGEYEIVSFFYINIIFLDSYKIAIEKYRKPSYDNPGLIIETLSHCDLSGLYRCFPLGARVYRGVPTCSGV